MRITIEVESVEELHRVVAALGAPAAAPASEPAKGKRAPKPVEPVKGNPDEPGETPPATPAPSAPASPAPAVELPKSVREDAPEEIKNLVAKPTDVETIGKAILKASKPVAEGGRTRAVAVGILEKFRPAGFTEKLVKVRDIPASEHPKLVALILAEYAA